MKFCYLDESGLGKEPFAIMVGIIVDSQRMHITKIEWSEILKSLEKLTNGKIKEFHTKSFYRGKGIWRNLEGYERAYLIDVILEWLKNRKHHITFCGLDKRLFDAEKNSNNYLKDIKSYWCLLALHQILIIQKSFQKLKGNKGNTVMIFDEAVKEYTKFSKLILEPPSWTDSYYEKKDSQLQLDQLVDIPYYGDSENVLLIQVADLIAYILRLYTEFEEKNRTENFVGEKKQISEWVKSIVDLSLSKSSRYPLNKRDDCSKLFFKYAPESIRML